MGGFSRSSEPMQQLDDDIRRPAWQLQAACRGAGAELFFPTRAPRLQEKVSTAKAICATCPVRKECLEYALYELPNEQRHFGIWGGLTEKERRKLRRDLSAAKRKAEETAA